MSFESAVGCALAQHKNGLMPTRADSKPAPHRSGRVTLRESRSLNDSFVGCALAQQFHSVALKHNLQNRHQQSGFTLMELVLVIVLLGIVATATLNFVQFGVDTYLDSASRQNMASSGRFVTERFSRELRNAVPGSVALRNDLIGAGDCLEFRPVAGAFAYLPDYNGQVAPIDPNPAANSIAVMPTSGFDYDSAESGYVAIIYPLNSTHVYTGGGRAVAIQTGGYNANGDNSFSFTFTGAAQFAAASPAKRLYVAHEVVTYCYMAGTDGAQLIRFAPNRFASNASPSANNGVLMGQWFSNQGSEPAFSIGQSSYSGSSLVRLMLRLTERDEEVVLNHEVHLLQAP